MDVLEKAVYRKPLDSLFRRWETSANIWLVTY